MEQTSKSDKVMKQLNKLTGISESKAVLRQYEQYLQLRKANDIQIGNMNVIIKCIGDGNQASKLVDLIHQLLKSNKLMHTKYNYVCKREIEYDPEFKKVTENMLVLDLHRLENSWKFMKTDVIKRVRENPQKVFVIVDYNSDNSNLRNITSEEFAWVIKIDEPTTEEVISHIKQTLRKNQIKVAKGCNLIANLAKETYDTINTELLDLTIQCKSQHIATITDNVLTEFNKSNYLKLTNKMTAMEELDSLIGLEDIKRQIKQVVNYIKVNKDRGDMPMLHMAFMGPSGCGKTEVAKLVGRIFAEEQILGRRFVSADRASLVAPYIGQTALKTKIMIDKAEGGILFIDEAYALNPRTSKNDFGHECISTLIAEMENRRNNLCVILAGYEREMEELLEANAGFESRIQFKIKFPDYSADELYEILNKFVTDNNYKLEKSTKDVLVNHFEQARKKANFGNARYARKLFDKLRFEQVDRITVDKTADINLITEADVKNVLSKLEEHQPKPKNRIGFSINVEEVGKTNG